jgi:hypothetical protein
MTKVAIFAVFIVALVIGILIGCFEAAPLRGGLVAALRTMLTNPLATAALIAAAIALLVGLLGFIGTWRQVNVAKDAAHAAKISAEAAKTSADAAMMNANYAGTRALASVRIDWLNALRDTLSEYHSILMSTDAKVDEKAKVRAEEKTAADKRQLSYFGTKLDLLLNQEKKYQKALWQVSDDILKMVSPSEEELNVADKRLVQAARKVLDFHWRKIKAEMIGESPLKEPPAQDADA